MKNKWLEYKKTHILLYTFYTYTFMTLNYDQFMRRFGYDIVFVKFLNYDMKHHNFNYKLGLNEDILQFNPSGTCQPGGLYFTNNYDMQTWKHYGELVAEIELCEDAMFYVENCRTKYKTNKFIIKNICAKNYDNFKKNIVSGIGEIYAKVLFNLDWRFCEIINFYNMVDTSDKKKIHDAYEYIRAIIYKNGSILFSKKNLLKNEFNIIYEKPEIEKLYNYFLNKGNMCIAGGYITLQFHNKKFQDYLDSDIDIYILCNDELSEESYSDTLKNFVSFLDSTYEISNIYCSKKNYEEKKCGVFDIMCKKLTRKINLICTCEMSIAQLLNNFDANYCKCCFYMGNTYVTPDAKMSKDTNNAVFYRNKANVSRIQKAKKLGFKVFNYEKKINFIHHIKKIEISMTSMMQNFTPVLSWCKDYV